MKRDYNRTEAILMGKDLKDNAPAYSELNCGMKPLSMIRQRYPYHTMTGSFHHRQLLYKYRSECSTLHRPG